jgi:hypothetical protein
MNYVDQQCVFSAHIDPDTKRSMTIMGENWDSPISRNALRIPFPILWITWNNSHAESTRDIYSWRLRQIDIPQSVAVPCELFFPSCRSFEIPLSLWQSQGISIPFNPDAKKQIFRFGIIVNLVQMCLL